MDLTIKNTLCIALLMSMSLVVLSADSPSPLDSPCNRINVHAAEISALEYCKLCVSTVQNATAVNKTTCNFAQSSNGRTCTADGISELVNSICSTEQQCDEKYGDFTTTTEPPPTTNGTTTTPSTPTTAPPTLPPNSTTTVPPTNVTTTTVPTTTTTTAAPVTNGTTTAAPVTNGTTTTAPVTTAKPSPAPAPHEDGGFRWGSFFGGIAFTAAMASVGYIVWRFYKARTERNYHTLTSNLI